MRVRLFNTYEPVTTFYRDLLPAWAELGWRVDVIISQAQYRSGRDRSWAVDGVKIRETPGKGLEPNHPLKKLAIMILYVVGAAAYSLLGKSVDVNLFLTQPPLFFVWGYVLKLIRGQSYGVVLMDIYPEIAVQAGALPETALHTRFLQYISSFALRKANSVIVIGRCMADRVQRLGVARERIHLVPNWTDQSLLTPVSGEENEFRRAQGWADKFVVLYSGNIGVAHYFDDILEAARRVLAQSEIQFVFAGDGMRRSEIVCFKEEHDLDNVTLLPFQSIDALSLSLGAGDLHFVSLRPGFEGVVVPSKTYGALAAGRPILYQGSRDGEIGHLILDHDVGTVVPPGNVDDLVVAILRYVADPELVERQGEQARRLAEEQFSKQRAIRQYTEIVSKLKG